MIIPLHVLLISLYLLFMGISFTFCPLGSVYFLTKTFAKFVALSGQNSLDNYWEKYGSLLSNPKRFGEDHYLYLVFIRMIGIIHLLLSFLFIKRLVVSILG